MELPNRQTYRVIIDSNLNDYSDLSEVIEELIEKYLKENNKREKISSVEVE